MTDVFVYGTLLFAPVRQVVLGRPTASEPAELAGFVRRCVHGVVYPGILPQEGERVTGAVVRGLEPVDLQRFDEFEDDFYERRTLRVVASGASSEADTYVLAPREAQRLSARPWSPEEFERQHLAAFLGVIGRSGRASG